METVKIESRSPKRYSDMMTYTPATFRHLPAELRLMIWDAMTDSTPILWDIWSHHLRTREIRETQQDPELTKFILLHRPRMRSVVTLTKLNRESRYHVLSRFWIALPIASQSCYFSPPWVTTPYAVDTKIDVFDLITYLAFDSTSFMSSCLPRIRTITLSLERLEDFLTDLSSGFYLLPALKKIYVKIPEVWSSAWDQRDIPTLQSASADDELVSARVIYRMRGSYSTALSAIQEELAAAKYIHANDGFKDMDRTVPFGWEITSTMDWSVLERLGLTCVFIYERIPIPLEDQQPLYHPLYVFSTSRGPETKIRESPPDRRIYKAEEIES